MIKYLCGTCGAAFDEPLVKYSDPRIDGHFTMCREELCPICGGYYFEPADECECGKPKAKGEFLCGECKKNLLDWVNAFADELTNDQESQIDAWMDGGSLTNRKSWR
jgi:tryptophanyl-tRNA synthetase